MTTRQPAPTDARDRVLRAALQAAAAAAPGPVRVADIASRAGMSAGHVMYYFQRRDRILAESLLYAEATLAAQRDRLVARSGAAPGALRGLVRLYLPSGGSDPRWRLWAQTLASPPDDAETLAALAEVVDSWQAALSTVIRRGHQDGILRCDDPDQEAYRSCRLMDGYALEVMLGTSGRTRAWAIRSVMAALGHMLAMPDPT